MQARLIVTQGREEIARLDLDRSPIEIGRLASNQLVLPSPSVSRRHARVSPREGGWEIVDLGSQNKLRVDGEIVDSHIFRDGDEIAVGPFKLTFRRNETMPEKQSSVPPSAPAPQSIRPLAAPYSGQVRVKEITCHHCWHRFEPADLVWISRHKDLLGDPIAGDESQLRFRPSRFNKEGEALDARSVPCQEFACPRCHLMIPQAFLEDKPMFFSIIGSPASGKTNILAAMVWKLRDVMFNRFGIAFTDGDTITNQLLNLYENMLFQQADGDQVVVLKKTELGGELYDSVMIDGQGTYLPRPFLFRIRRADSRHVAQQTGRVLVLYDNAGEHFLPSNDTTNQPGTQHMAQSEVLFFVFDPTQVPEFRRKCNEFSNDPQLRSVKESANPDAPPAIQAYVSPHTIITEAALRVRKYAGMSASQQLDKLLLVLVSKSDVWSPLLPGVNFLNETFIAANWNPGDGPATIVSHIDQVSTQLRGMLSRLTPSFVAAAEDAFRTVVYLPISALGASPDPLSDNPGAFGIRAKLIKPCWVTAPMLYAFSKLSPELIDTSRVSPKPELVEPHGH